MKQYLGTLLALSLILALVSLSGCSSTNSEPGGKGQFLTAPVELGKGGGSTGGRKDSRVDVPAQISSVTTQSSMRIHISSVAGSDASGTVRPAYYEIRNDAGVVTYAPSGLLVGDPTTLYQMNVEGLRPGAHYRVTLRSTDLYGNVGYSNPVDVTMPAQAAETQPPSTLGPYYSVGILIAPTPTVQVKASDNTAIGHVNYYFNGVLQYSLGLADSGVVRSWTDAQASTSYFQWLVPSNLVGLSGTVRVDVFDPLGNLTSVSAPMTL
jgi:hypothetical protein